MIRVTRAKDLARLRVTYPAWHITRDKPGEAALTAKRTDDRGVVIIPADDGATMAAKLQEYEGHKSSPRERKD